jgi:hypothetical protein
LHRLVDQGSHASARDDSQGEDRHVSTTEELAYPGYTHIRQAQLIHAWAKKAKVAVLATGEMTKLGN